MLHVHLNVFKRKHVYWWSTCSTYTQRRIRARIMKKVIWRLSGYIIRCRIATVMKHEVAGIILSKLKSMSTVMEMLKIINEKGEYGEISEQWLIARETRCLCRLKMRNIIEREVQSLRYKVRSRKVTKLEVQSWRDTKNNQQQRGIILRDNQTTVGSARNKIYANWRWKTLSEEKYSHEETWS